MVRAMNQTQSIGGQAVIEGVMFKSRRGWAVAVRDPSGDIHLRCEPLKARRIEKIPLIRGFFILFSTLILGVKALEYSAQVAAQDEKPIKPWALALTIATSFALAVGIFLFLPLYLTKLLGIVFHAVSGSGVLFNLVDGVIRVLIFLFYVWVIGLWREMRRVFQYHGAEHMVIHAFESGDISMENIEAKSPLHPRCGTSFLLIVMVLSILVFSFIPQGWPFLLKFLSRIVLIPVIAGVSYEILKASARFAGHPVMRLLILPGLALQRLTTRQPETAQIAVSLKAFEGVMAFEDKIGNE